MSPGTWVGVRSHQASWAMEMGSHFRVLTQDLCFRKTSGCYKDGKGPGWRP